MNGAHCKETTSSKPGTDLGNELSHKLHHGRIVSKLPNEHGHLFHGDLALVFATKDIVD